MYVKVLNGNPVSFPYELSQLKNDNSSTSFPAVIPASVLADYNVFEVALTARPDIDSRTHKVTQEVAEVNGVWTQEWIIQRLPTEQAINNVCADRNIQLSDSDWTQLPDSPVDRVAWAVYRQALRDVTTQLNFPWNIQWPESP
jgi:hypothetical protein|tara:strand:+ start:455 stop:883 length:429 start_codon:yes stop_codon:yes gene_type:complete